MEEVVISSCVQLVGEISDTRNAAGFAKSRFIASILLIFSDCKYDYELGLD